MAGPWWIDRVAALLTPLELHALELGPLWRLREQLQFIRENVEPALLALDVAASGGAREAWQRFEAREHQVAVALGLAGEACAVSIRSGALGPRSFRAGWEGLGYVRHDESGGTPADDYLDGLLHLSRHTPFAAPTAFGLLNLATRAARVADFLSVSEPAGDDVVFDLGSGSGKLALTVAASTFTSVRGVEFEPTYASAARRSAQWLGLGNVAFDTADVRDVELSGGSVFYLYYPFHGSVAQTVAQRLGALAREKDIVIYLSGPQHDFGEFFLGEVAAGALSLTARRGEFGEVLHLESARA